MTLPNPPSLVPAEARSLYLGDNEPFRLLVEAVKDYAIIILDVEGNIATWNVGAERIKGYRAAEIVGSHFSRFYTPEDLASGLPERLLAAARANGRVEDEGWRMRKDGGRFWANVTITPLYDSLGLQVGYGKVTRDLTARRHMESLQESTSQLHEFLAMLSHELRNPIAPIVNGVALLRALPEARRDDVLGMLDRQVSHLSRLVDDLLDVARLTRGKIVLKRERVALAPLVTQALEACSALVESRRHRIMASTPPDAVEIEADATRIVQVIVNLVTNAAKYTSAGGDIAVHVRREGGEAVIEVQDSGIGLAPSQIDKVFDLFVQGDRALDRPEGGLGIGLTLVRRMVELHGGRVAAQSDGVGLGSRFVVRLPLAGGATSSLATRPAEAVAEPATKAAATPASRLRVLVVDDNRDFASTLTMLLELEGHDVLAVHDGIAGYDAALSYRPDVVLMDIGLPGVTGYELARKLRQVDGLAGRTLIALTGYGQAEDRRRVREAGFDLHLVKPVDPDALLRAVGASRRPA